MPSRSAPSWMGSPSPLATPTEPLTARPVGAVAFTSIQRRPLSPTVFSLRTRPLREAERTTTMAPHPPSPTVSSREILLRTPAVAASTTGQTLLQPLRTAFSKGIQQQEEAEELPMGLTLHRPSQIVPSRVTRPTTLVERSKTIQFHSPPSATASSGIIRTVPGPGPQSPRYPSSLEVSLPFHIVSLKTQVEAPVGTPRLARTMATISTLIPSSSLRSIRQPHQLPSAISSFRLALPLLTPETMPQIPNPPTCSIVSVSSMAMPTRATSSTSEHTNSFPSPL